MQGFAGKGQILQSLFKSCLESNGKIPKEKRSRSELDLPNALPTATQARQGNQVAETHLLLLFGVRPAGVRTPDLQLQKQLQRLHPCAAQLNCV